MRLDFHLHLILTWFENTSDDTKVCCVAGRAGWAKSKFVPPNFSWGEGRGMILWPLPRSVPDDNATTIFQQSQ